MITISLTQGLGNQLFQYFFGESLGIDFKDKVEVNYLQDLLPPDQLKMWEVFDIKINWIDDHQLKKNFLFKLSPQTRDLFIKLAKILSFNKNLLTIDDSNIDLNIINKLRQNIYLRGYWQNIEYSKKNFKFILTKLKFKKKLDLNLLIKKKYKNKFSSLVGVHIRGGDYLLKKNYLLKNNIDLNYYLDSMYLMKKNFKNPIFLLFSDDRTYLEQMNLSKYFNCLNIFDLSTDRVDDFQYLSQCNHFIIPNSTFSLWAFYLNKNPDKFIITPDTWFSFRKNSINNFIHEKYIKKKNSLKEKFL